MVQSSRRILRAPFYPADGYLGDSVAIRQQRLGLPGVGNLKVGDEWANKPLRS